MRTSTYSGYLARMQALCGVESLLNIEEQHMLEYFRSSIREAWEMFEHPDLCPKEEVQTDSDGIIPFIGATNDDIGSVLAIWDNDPDAGAGASELSWRLEKDGIRVLPAPSSTVWINYRIALPEYEGDDYVNATAYAVGDQVYHPSSGKFYKCMVASTGNEPPNEPYWREIPIPYVLFEYVVQASMADALSAEGFDEKASRRLAMAERKMQVEFDKVQRQQRQVPRFTIIRTHGTMQSGV